MAGEILRILEDEGPSRSANVAARLVEMGISAGAARQRISRTDPPIRKFPIPLLPKNEAFLYLDDQRTSEQMWTNFVRDLRATNAVYAGALDGIDARGGVVLAEDFPIIAGAPIAMKAQVTSDNVITQLKAAGIIRTLALANAGEVIELALPGIGTPDYGGLRPRRLGETILLDALKDWVRRTGMGGYNSVAIRGDTQLRQIGQFRFDLTAASYLLPLRPGAGGGPGFMGADVFVDGELNENHIRYFVRKTQLLNATLRKGKALTLIVAPSFTGQAHKVGHAAGIMMATPADLFGRRAGDAIVNLVGTLKNAAAVVAGNPDRFATLVEDLTQVEGAAGNIRGVLFELICFYLARRNAVSADFGVTARDPVTGETRDIDVLAFIDPGHITAIECKGRAPGGVVELDEVEAWLGKLRVMRAHFAAQDRLREAQMQFEIWTSGTFSEDALRHLKREKQRRTKTQIDWKDGEAVANLARAAKERAILKGLQEHFLHHPLATMDP